MGGRACSGPPCVSRPRRGLPAPAPAGGEGSGAGEAAAEEEAPATEDAEATDASEALADDAPVIHESLMDYKRSANMNPQAGSNICDQTLIEAMGIRIPIIPQMIEMYQRQGLDLTKLNESADWTLPLEATFLADKDRRVIKACAYPYPTTPDGPNSRQMNASPPVIDGSRRISYSRKSIMARTFDGMNRRDG